MEDGSRGEGGARYRFRGWSQPGFREFPPGRKRSRCRCHCWRTHTSPTLLIADAHYALTKCSSRYVQLKSLPLGRQAWSGGDDGNEHLPPTAICRNSSQPLGIQRDKNGPEHMPTAPKHRQRSRIEIEIVYAVSLDGCTFCSGMHRVGDGRREVRGSNWKMFWIKKALCEVRGHWKRSRQTQCLPRRTA